MVFQMVVWVKTLENIYLYFTTTKKNRFKVDEYENTVK